MKKILSIILVMLLTVPAWATDFYVANSGSDSADGLTTGTAWQTLAKVNASIFLPDDVIYLIRDGVWSETLIPSSSGITDHPIIFDAYGTGADPLIQGDGTTSLVTNYSSLDVEGKSYLTFKHIQFHGTNTTNGSFQSTGFYSTVINSGADHIVYDAITIYNLDTPSAFNQCFVFYNTGNSTIENSTVHQCGYGVMLYIHDGGHYANNILNNEIYDLENGLFQDWDGVKAGDVVGVDGVLAEGDYSGTLIQGNNIHDFGEDAMDLIAMHGNFTIRGNHLHSPNDKYAASPNINGIKVLSFTGSVDTEITIEDNIIEDLTTAYTSGICVNNDTAVTNRTLIIRNNLCLYEGGLAVRSRTGSNTNQIYNNTFIGTGTGMRLFGGTWDVKNNIIDGDTNDFEIAGATVTSDYNIFVNDSGPNLSSGTYTDGGHNLYVTDPLLNGDYTLQNSSPGCNAGATIGSVTSDLAGISRPQGSAYEIGAYENGNCSGAASPNVGGGGGLKNISLQHLSIH